MSALCAHPGCELDEDEHHEFEPFKVPAGCKCDPRDWSPSPIPAVCAGPYVENPFGDCANCQHIVECHPPKTEETTTADG